MAGLRVQFDLDEISALAVIGNLQLALRHPLNTGPTSEIARNIVKLMIGVILDPHARPEHLDPRLVEEWRREGYIDTPGPSGVILVPGGRA